MHEGATASAPSGPSGSTSVASELLSTTHSSAIATETSEAPAEIISEGADMDYRRGFSHRHQRRDGNLSLQQWCHNGSIVKLTQRSLWTAPMIGLLIMVFSVVSLVALMSKAFALFRTICMGIIRVHTQFVTMLYNKPDVFYYRNTGLLQLVCQNLKMSFRNISVSVHQQCHHALTVVFFAGDHSEV